MKDYTLPYYRWWLQNIVAKNLSSSKQSWLNEWLNKYGHDIERVKSLSLKATSLRLHNNSDARKKGRAAEETVVRILNHNGWVTSSQLDLALKPEFGESTVGYDIIATYGNNNPRHIEVKYCNGPLRLSYKQFFRYQKNIELYDNHFYVFVNEDNKVFYVRTSEMKFCGTVQSLVKDRWKFAWIIDPKCLKQIK